VAAAAAVADVAAVAGVIAVTAGAVVPSLVKELCLLEDRLTTGLAVPPLLAAGSADGVTPADGCLPGGGVRPGGGLMEDVAVCC